MVMNLTKNTQQTKSRQLFSPVIGHYDSEYSENTHGAPQLFITIMAIMVKNVPNTISQ